MEGDLRDGAIDRAYREHAADMYRVAYGVLRDRDDATEVTTDTFARAWERWDQYDDQRPLRAWLHGIVVHLALDKLRRQRVRRRLVPSLIDNLTTSNRPVASDPAIEIVLRHVVDQALDALTPRARAALVLRHYYGYAYGEIGAMLGMKSGTVGSTLSRAHSDLRRRMRPSDEASDGSDVAAEATPATSTTLRVAEPVAEPREGVR
jgi:RNA polymerase sigma-70 factor, ECF subfamily